MSDESSLSFSEDVEVAKRNGNPTGSDDSYQSSSPDLKTELGDYYKCAAAPGKIRGRRGKAKRILSPEEMDSKRLLANSQERDRMDKLNTALENLRRHLPHSSLRHNRRLSKIRTLTIARQYIESLSRMIYEHDMAYGSGTNTSSCLYAPRDDASGYHIPVGQSEIPNSRVPDHYSYERLQDQHYHEPSFHPSFLNQRNNQMNPYQNPQEDGYFPWSLVTAIHSDIMARPISEVTSLGYYTSTPVRSHPYSGR